MEEYKFPDLDEHNMFNAPAVRDYAIEFYNLNYPDATKIIGEQALELERLKSIIKKMATSSGAASEAMDKILTMLSDIRHTSHFYQF